MGRTINGVITSHNLKGRRSQYQKYYYLPEKAHRYRSYAMLFGVVTGMMVFMSCNELIPTALKYDPGHKYFYFLFFIRVHDRRHDRHGREPHARCRGLIEAINARE